jgi:hypothetical protein
MPWDATWVMRIKPTPLIEMLYIEGAVPRKMPIIRQECKLTLLCSSSPRHLVVDKLEALFAQTCSMYSSTVEKSKSPYLLRVSVFTWNAADVAGIAV